MAPGYRNAVGMPGTPRPDERLLETAYELFSARGVRDVGVDELVERAGVAKATLYRHFASKDDLILAFLKLREERWTVGWFEQSVRTRGSTPEEQLLATFDLFEEWFREPGYAGCPFIKVLLEMDKGHPAGAACVEHLETVSDFLAQGRHRGKQRQGGVAGATDLDQLVIHDQPELPKMDRRERGASPQIGRNRNWQTQLRRSFTWNLESSIRSFHKL